MVLAITASPGVTLASIEDPAGNVWQIDETAHGGAGTVDCTGCLVSCKVEAAYEAGASLTINLSAVARATVFVEEFDDLHSSAWAAGGAGAGGVYAASPVAFASGPASVAAQAGDLVFGALTASDNNYTEAPTVSVVAEASAPTAWTKLLPSAHGRYSNAYGYYRIVEGDETPNFNGTLTRSGNSIAPAAIVGIYRKAEPAPEPEPEPEPGEGGYNPQWREGYCLGFVNGIDHGQRLRGDLKLPVYGCSFCSGDHV